MGMMELGDYRPGKGSKMEQPLASFSAFRRGSSSSDCPLASIGNYLPSQFPNRGLLAQLSFRLVSIITIVFATTAVPAGPIFESGSLGSTGARFIDLVSGGVPGTNVNNTVYTGVRFYLDRPVVTSQIGGHFVENSGGTFFGAVVTLDNESDFPDSFDFTTSDFIGSTLLTFPNPSDVVFGELTLSLAPGWYALVFGGGLFDATGTGASVSNGTDIGNPTYIAGQPISGVDWFDISSLLPNHRFIIQGQVVPEPTSFILAYMSTLLFFFRTRAAWKQY